MTDAEPEPTPSSVENDALKSEILALTEANQALLTENQELKADIMRVKKDAFDWKTKKEALELKYKRGKAEISKLKHEASRISSKLSNPWMAKFLTAITIYSPIDECISFWRLKFLPTMGQSTKEIAIETAVSEQGFDKKLSVNIFS
jgi:predicted RNase H-like nuclease (RuvC/YqgF family)